MIDNLPSPESELPVELRNDIESYPGVVTAVLVADLHPQRPVRIPEQRTELWRELAMADQWTWRWLRNAPSDGW